MVACTSSSRKAPALERHRLFGPQPAHRFEALDGPRDLGLGVDVEGGEFLLAVSGAGADGEAPSGQDVQSRQLLGQLHRAVQREQDGGAEADRLRLTGQAGERRDRLEGLVGMGDIVMPDAEVLVSKGLGFAGPAENIGDTAA